MKVRLFLDNTMLYNDVVMRAARTAFGDGFGNKYARSWHRTGGVSLIATAEQLMAFLVARDKLGATNAWKALRVEILDPQPCATHITVDVRPCFSR